MALLFFSLFFEIEGKDSFVGVRNQQALLTVKNNGLAVVDVMLYPVGTDNGRGLYAAGQDCGM